MTHGSLFSGIGGFDLAAAWAGWTNVFNCEIDPFCRRVLKYHFPESEQYEDIQTTDFTVWRDCIDVLTGGFPTQSPICRGDDGLPLRLDYEAVRRVIRCRSPFSAWRRESIKAYGNAIVPQVALRIFETINEYERI